MLKTFLGPVEEDAAVVYLRPETAQGIYVNFKNVQATSRKKLPFGIAQIGKAFRNEISPGNFVFRMREFEQMEMQYFVRPDEAAAAFEEWLPRRRAWYERYGVTPSRLRFREHRPDELAHYAKKAIDVEYRFPFGWKELEGIHNRGDFDLGAIARASGREPAVLRPGDRGALHPVDHRDPAGGDRAALHVPHRRLPRGGGPRREARLAGAPSGARAVQGRGPAAAQEATRDRGPVPQDQGRPAAPHDGRLRRHGRDRQAVPAPGRDRHAVVRHGRRRSLEDGAVTVRDRDSMAQERVPVEGVTRLILDRLEASRARPDPMTAAGDITAAVRGWLDGLDDAQRRRATFPFDSDSGSLGVHAGHAGRAALADMRPTSGMPRKRSSAPR